MLNNRLIRSLTATLFAFPLAAVSFGTPVVWNGPTVSFSKAGFANETLAQNQDHLTSNIWLTRGRP